MGQKVVAPKPTALAILYDSYNIQGEVWSETESITFAQHVLSILEIREERRLRNMTNDDPGWEKIELARSHYQRNLHMLLHGHTGGIGKFVGAFGGLGAAQSGGKTQGRVMLSKKAFVKGFVPGLMVLGRLEFDEKSSSRSSSVA